MPKQQAPGCFLIVFGSIFTIVGTIALGICLYEMALTIATYSWQETPATIQSLEIDFPNKAPHGDVRSVFELKASYSYVVDGQQHTGDMVRRRPFTSSSYEELADAKAKLLREEVGHVFVDPESPGKAIVQRDSLWDGFLILFPLPFIVVGLVIVAAGLGWFRGSNARLFKKEGLRNSAGNGASRMAMMLFGTIFLFAGLLMLYFIALRPMSKINSAADWQEVACKVIWSRVEVHDGEDSDSYSPDVFFEYQFDGETHRSNRYSFVEMSTSSRSQHAEIVRQFPKGKETTCFVDPNTPWHAVLRRDTSQIGFWWLFPLPFIAVGITVLWFSLRNFEPTRNVYANRDH